MMTEKYNNWVNQPTWAVNLWLGNEENTYRYFQDLAKENTEPGDLAKLIKEYVEENNPLSNESSLYSDILTSALSSVDWFEIAQAMLEE